MHIVSGIIECRRAAEARLGHCTAQRNPAIVAAERAVDIVGTRPTVDPFDYRKEKIDKKYEDAKLSQKAQSVDGTSVGIAFML